MSGETAKWVRGLIERELKSLNPTEIMPILNKFNVDRVDGREDFSIQIAPLANIARRAIGGNTKERADAERLMLALTLQERDEKRMHEEIDRELDAYFNTPGDA